MIDDTYKPFSNKELKATKLSSYRNCHSKKLKRISNIYNLETTSTSVTQPRVPPHHSMRLSTIELLINGWSKLQRILISHLLGCHLARKNLMSVKKKILPFEGQNAFQTLAHVASNPVFYLLFSLKLDCHTREKELLAYKKK